MNANELADGLESATNKLIGKEHELGGRAITFYTEAATMLRQQQEKLTKYELRHVAQRDRIAILEMQHKQQQAEIEALKKEAALQRLSDFTQEAEKTLTDGEIMQVWWDANDITDDDTVIEFARAILRKASEK